MKKKKYIKSRNCNVIVLKPIYKPSLSVDIIADTTYVWLEHKK